MKHFKAFLPGFSALFFLACSAADSKDLVKKTTSTNVVAVTAMHENRASHTATLLKNGKVLIAGGFRKGPDGRSQLYSNTSEIYDPQSYTFITSGDLNVERCDHTATLLPDGNVLVTGGFGGQRLASAELYNAKSGSWEQLPDMKATRGGHEAILLSNNQVLIIGGSNSKETFAEIFNYGTKQFEKVIAAPVNLIGSAVVMLQNGKVLVAGGDINNQPVEIALLFDVRTGSFTETGKMSIVRRKASVALLPNGNALIVGGSNNRDWKGKYTSTEIYDAGMNTFSKGPELNFERFKLNNAVVTLKDGSILITGGDKHIEILSPGASKFDIIGELEQPLYFSTSTLLSNGNTLIAGGYGNDVQATNSAWILHD